MPIIDWSSKRIKIDPGADIQEIIEALQKDLDSKVTAAVLNAALAAEKAERVEGDEEVLENSKLILTEEDPESGTHNGYILTQGNRLVGHIHTPSIIKNAYLEKDGEITYLVLEFAGAVEPVKIDVTELIDLYKGSKGEMIEITIDANNTISATIIDGSITRAKVAEDIETSLQKADDAAAYTDEQVAAEKAERVAEDSRIEGLVNTEKERAQGVESTLSEAILTESATRASEDEKLQNAIDAEKAAREAADTALDEKIVAETERATNKENELAEAIEAEQSRAEGVETELNDAIVQEITDREYYISEEEKARIAADEAEKTRAEAKEAALEAAISKEVTDRQEAVEAAVEAAEQANEALHTTISGEWSVADSDLKEEIQGWVEDKKYATVAYVDSIDATKADRSEVNSKIAEEIANRENADQATITAAKAYADEKAAEVEAKIPSLEEYRKSVDQDVIDESKADKATTLAGYSISDAYTKEEVDDNIRAVDTAYKAADKELQDAIANENQQRTTIDEDLNRAIQDEQTAREDGDAAVKAVFPVVSAGNGIVVTSSTAEGRTTYTIVADASVFQFRGYKETIEELPTEGNVTGDCYAVGEKHTLYAWDGDEWVAIGNADSIDAVDTTVKNGIHLTKSGAVVGLEVVTGSIAEGDESVVTGGAVYSALQESGKVQDVKVNGESVLEGKNAVITLKTVGGTAITGEGDININTMIEVEALPSTEINEKVLYKLTKDMTHKEQKAIIDPETGEPIIVEVIITDYYAGIYVYIDGWKTLYNSNESVDYNDITNKPKINGVVISGNKTSEDLGILTENDLDGYQKKTDDALDTTAKTIVGAINELKAGASTVYKYKGSVATVEALPAEAEVGDSYYVEDEEATYAYNGEAFLSIGGTGDLSVYQKAEDDKLTTTDKTVVGAINELDKLIGDIDAFLAMITTGGGI